MTDSPRHYLHIWDNVCGVCRFGMSLADDIENGQHASCVRIAWPTGSRERRLIGNRRIQPKGAPEHLSKIGRGQYKGVTSVTSVTNSHSMGGHKDENVTEKTVVTLFKAEGEEE